MELLVQQVVNSLSIGGIYAMVAVGLTLIFGILNVLNFAHGEFFMLGAFAAYFLLSALGVPYLLALPIVALLIAALGWVMGKTLKLRSGRPFETMILLTLGVSIVLQNGALTVWGVDLRSVRTSFTDSSREVLGAVVSDQRLLVFGIAVVVFVALDWFVRTTRTGKAMRAVAQNQEAAAVVGIDVVRISLLALAVGSGLTGLAGALLAPIIAVNPQMGLAYLMRSFAIITMAGRGNVKGAIVSSFLLALIESVGTQYLGLAFKDLFAFLALTIVLLVKPEGLFGRRSGLA
jgi:branched-chain amino acid transport system permease protein